MTSFGRPLRFRVASLSLLLLLWTWVPGFWDGGYRKSFLPCYPSNQPCSLALCSSEKPCILLPCIQYKNYWGILYSFFFSCWVFKYQCVLHIIPSQSGLAEFQGFKSHMCVVATGLDRVALNYITQGHFTSYVLKARFPRLPKNWDCTGRNVTSRTGWTQCRGGVRKVGSLAKSPRAPTFSSYPRYLTQLSDSPPIESCGRGMECGWSADPMFLKRLNLGLASEVVFAPSDPGIYT